MAGIYCEISKKKFSIEYDSEGLSRQRFKCPYVLVDNRGVYCDEVGFKKCPLYNLLNRIAKIDTKVLDELVKN